MVRNAKPAPPGEPAPDFETALKELESLVERLERGEQTLEQALADFERGVALARRCQDALAHAELKVQQLVERGGTTTQEPFDEGRGAGGEP